MTPRSHSKSVVFNYPFELKGVDRILPAGDYRVVTDEELIEELSFPVYRRISTMIFPLSRRHLPNLPKRQFHDGIFLRLLYSPGRPSF
jgi:hypothetical protein